MDSTLLHRLLIAAGLLAFVLGVTLLRPPPTQGPFARDFEAYYAAGAVWNAGGDPWSRDVWRVERTISGVDASRDELLPFVGPAAALPLFGALARLPHPYAVRIWTAALFCAWGALVYFVLLIAGAVRARTAAAAALFSIAAGPLTSALALGQTALLSAAALAGVLAALERRNLGAAIAATFAAALQPNLALVLAARARTRTALAAFAIAAAAFAAVTLAAGRGATGFAAYLHRLGEHGRAEAWVAIQHTPAAIAWSLGADASAASGAGTVIALAALVAVAVATVRARLTPLEGTLLAIAALPLAVPFFHEHDFAIELIPLIVLAVRANGTARALGGIAAVLVLVDWLGLAQRPPADPQIVVLGLAVACAYAALRRTPPGRADLAAFIALGAACVVAVPLAHAFPAPTWPDALPAAYRAPASANASGVWGDEGRAAGLERRQPAWGALRALPLAGCVVLGFGLVLSARYRRP